MRPIQFLEANCVLAKNQPEYVSIPAYKTKNGKVITKWRLTFKERIKLLFGQKLWITVLTFNKPFQPISLNIYCPPEVPDLDPAGIH